MATVSVEIQSGFPVQMRKSLVAAKLEQIALFQRAFFIDIHFVSGNRANIWPVPRPLPQQYCPHRREAEIVGLAPVDCRGRARIFSSSLAPSQR